MKRPYPVCEDCGFPMHWHCSEHGCCPREETAKMYKEHENLQQAHIS
ncbi:MAG: hypothetical protein V3W28_04285 [Thermoplasmata archaeon]